MHIQRLFCSCSVRARSVAYLVKSAGQVLEVCKKVGVDSGEIIGLVNYLHFNCLAKIERARFLDIKNRGIWNCNLFKNSSALRLKNM